VDLSIVLVSFNTRETTRRCLETIFRETRGLVFEVIVVDNDSRDGSAAMIAAEFPGVRLIRNDRNSGFGAAQNIGLGAARGEFLLVMNSDVFFVGNAARRLVDLMRQGPADVGAVGPEILNPDGTWAPSARRAVQPGPVLILKGINRHFPFRASLPEDWMRRRAGFLFFRWHDNYQPRETTREADWVDGMCVLFRRAALEESGLFDERYFFDYEIVDLSMRLRRRGWRIVFDRRASVVHEVHSSRSRNPRILVETHRSELLFYADYAPQNYRLLIRTFRVLVGVKKVLLNLGLGGAKGSREAAERRMIYDRILALSREMRTPAAVPRAKIPALPPLPEVKAWQP